LDQISHSLPLKPTRTHYPSQQDPLKTPREEGKNLKMSSTTVKGPYTLVTVNNAPERAQRLVGRVVEIVKDRYVIKHVANAESERSTSIVVCLRMIDRNDKKKKESVG
jgi:hypothetical protein